MELYKVYHNKILLLQDKENILQVSRDKNMFNDSFFISSIKQSAWHKNKCL